MDWLTTLRELLGWALILSGGFFTVVGALGVLRLPDFWARLHGASITDSAGVILLLAGMGLQAGLSLVTLKLAIIGVFLFITGPTATHAVANAALVSGLRPKDAEGLRSHLPPPAGPGDPADAADTAAAADRAAGAAREAGRSRGAAAQAQSDAAPDSPSDTASDTASDTGPDAPGGAGPEAGR